jgi:Ni/Fe-hydrogenase subunit HybB-like protein
VAVRRTLVLAAAAAGLALAGARAVAGLGAVTALNDGYAWGASKPLHASAVGGAGAGALALAAVLLAAGRGRSGPLLATALGAGGIAHLAAAASAVLELGRWWRAWALLVPPRWIPETVLLAATPVVVACAVLAARPSGRLAAPLAALAAALSLAHQGALGSSLLVAGPKLHPLWATPWLPVLFLLSSLTLGISAVIAIGAWREEAGRAREPSGGAGLALALAAAALAFVALRVGAVASSGALGEVHGPKGLLFVVELALLLPAIRLLAPSRRDDPARRAWAALVALAAGVLYRLDAHLAAIDPGPGFVYFPSVGELLLSAALGSAGLALWSAAGARRPSAAP